MDAGTGLVHIAPGHGEEDYELGRALGLQHLQPGRRRRAVHRRDGALRGARPCGRRIPRSSSSSRARGALVAEVPLDTHVPALLALQEPDAVPRDRAVVHRARPGRPARARARGDPATTCSGFPAWGEERIYNMIAHRPDWTISRQRVWGVPIVAFYCESCEHAPGRGAARRARGAHLPRGRGRRRVVCALGARAAARRARAAPSAAARRSARRPTSSTSGSTRAAATPPCWRRVRSCTGRPSSTWRARISTAAGSTPRCWRRWARARRRPTRRCSRAASWWTARAARCPSRSATVWRPRSSCPSTAPTCCGCGRPTRTTPRTSACPARSWTGSPTPTGASATRSDSCSATSADFDPRADRQPYERLDEVDRFILDRLARLIDRVVRAYEEYQFHTVFHAVHNFCAVDLSALYLDVIKDRLYTSAARRPAAARGADGVLRRLPGAGPAAGADPHVHDRGGVAPPAGRPERERAPRAVPRGAAARGSTTTSSASGIVCSRCAAKWPRRWSWPGDAS